MKYRPPSISDKGLDRHLDEKAESHNNFDYRDFVSMVESGVSKSSIARAFGVSRNTVLKWLEIFNSESLVKK